ncbi:molybdate ABC transporter permease subunit [Brevundimonas subvibrioides]|uniref:Molybdenum transport system permease n=1 Tax=Brevundimonas subvibrioides (strain ATCC 15264 / DSM 4735 / LMG 14903 / NBRC 16000 / CB 81) TaxID=633149 RepID=D9QIC6_BRESC|nr:molybdate ABC transporter permease subunit [Brevundimonas subvibrioides]ADK99428.1 molybdate ABC transporter, inner membrane subunit [Brevundimonas subvibrioides ATCC 15264]
MSDLVAPLSAAEVEALGLSLRVAGIATLATLPAAVGLGWILARGRFPGKWLVEAAVSLPLVLPPVVTGLALLLLFGSRGPLGSLLADVFGVSLLFHWTGAALAAGIMALPLMVRPIRLAIEGVDRGLEQAAATLGAPPAFVFFSVVLPLALPGVIAGALLGFARAFGEFGATVTFVGAIPGETRTLPVAIYGALQGVDGETSALRLALISIAVAVIALVGTEAVSRVLGRRSVVA